MPELEAGGTEQAVSTQPEAGAVQAVEQTVNGGAATPVEPGGSGVDAVRAEEFKQLQGAHTRATQELSAFRKATAGMSPEQIGNLIQAIQANPHVATQLLNPQPSTPAEPDVSGNVYLQDPDARAAMEHLNRPYQERLTAQEQRVNALMANMAQEAIGRAAASFLDTHKEYGLTKEQLQAAALELGPALKMRPDDPTLIHLAAVKAAGGLDHIAEKAGAAKVQAYIDQSKGNSRVGTTVQSGSPATMAPTPPKSLKDPSFRAKIVGLLEAADQARK
jgi:hypothetical protein